MRPHLTVGYSCLADRVADLRLPEQRDGVEVLVAVQGDPIPSLPPQVRTIAVPGLGVARSRNAVIGAASGRFLLFCDDDVDVDVDGALDGARRLEASGHALALGRAVDADGRPRKNYPSRVRRVTRFNSAKAATFEMLVDVDQVRDAGLRFDERFGAGAELYLGDEFIFITDLLAAGLHGVAVPSVFGRHPHSSSGDRWGTDADTHVRAVVINRVFGRGAPIVRVLFAAKQRRRLGSWRRFLRFVGDGGRPPTGSSSDRRPSTTPH